MDTTQNKQLLYLSDTGCCFCGGLFELYLRRSRSKCVGLCSIWADKNECFLSNATTLTSSGSLRGKLLLYATSMQKGTHQRGMLQKLIYNRWGVLLNSFVPNAWGNFLSSIVCIRAFLDTFLTNQLN